MFIMSFDFGMKNIGVAIGQYITKTASPIVCLRAKRGIPNWLYVERLINIWLVKKVVIGYPHKKKGNYKLINTYIHKFAKNLHGRFGLKVYFSDEQFTSCIARFYIKNKTSFYNSFYSIKNIHSISAVLILERWFKEK